MTSQDKDHKGKCGSSVKLLPQDQDHNLDKLFCRLY